MASALHSRYILSTSIEGQAEDAQKQLAALEMAEELGLDTRCGISGQYLELHMDGGADTVATLIQRLWEKDVWIIWIDPGSKAEQDLLTAKVSGMTQIADIYGSR